MKYLTPFFCVLLFTTSYFAQTTDLGKNASIKFEALSIRFMTAEERSRWAADNLNPDLCVRYRLSNEGKVPLYFATDFPNVINPSGNYIKKYSDGTIVWLKGASGVELPKSMGLLKYSSSAWVRLDEGESIEFLGLEISTKAEETHAKTIFVKAGENGKITEVFSSFYKVPVTKDN